MIKLIQHVNNSSLYVDACAHGSSGYLVVIQPQLVQQQSMTYIYTNRCYCSITDLYIYTWCSAVALIVVELRPGSHYAMRDHLLFLFSNICLCLGETGRSLKTRKAEHIRNVKKHNNGSNIAKHAWDNDHVIDFDSAKIIDTGNFRSRLTLESWHTAKGRNADNNSKPLPRQCTILIKKT